MSLNQIYLLHFSESKSGIEMKSAKFFIITTFPRRESLKEVVIWGSNSKFTMSI